MRDIRKRDKTEAPPARRLDQSIGYELGRAFRRLSRGVSAAARPHGLSASQGNILLTLWTKGPMPIGELQEELSASSSAFTGALDRMEQAGLVRRVPVPTDRRSFRVEPVEWPGSRRSALLRDLIAAEDELLAKLTPKERTQLLALLRKIGGDGV